MGSFVASALIKHIRESRGAGKVFIVIQNGLAFMGRVSYTGDSNHRGTIGSKIERGYE